MGTLPVGQQRRASRWSADSNAIALSNVERLQKWLGDRHDLWFENYHDLHRWSTEQLGQFWDLLFDYFEIQAAHRGPQATDAGLMPDITWFPGTRVNYVDQIFRHAARRGPAIIGVGEPGGLGERALSWAELRGQVAAVAATLRGLGVSSGNRVAGYVPNVVEAVVAFLATASLGAIWSSCGQDYSAIAAAARLGQLEPVVLVTSDGYRYAGKNHDRRGAIAALQKEIPSLRSTIVVPRLGLDLNALPDVVPWSQASGGDHVLEPAAVDFSHPLWVLFSSGTTGKPKGIVHGHGGVLLEHLKQMSFHLDLGEDDTYFWYTSPSWMMWNFQVAGLLVGATIVCYDGSPAYPAADAIWALAARHGVTVLGTSPAYLQACEKARCLPGAEHDLPSLRTLGVTGSVLPATSSHWVARHVGADVAVVSVTGGTDVVSAFAGSVPTVPIRPGELSVPCLGAALEAWDSAGRSIRGDIGELVITRPLPSMPLYLWNDPDKTRYREAYFSTYPGVWRHGDWITVTERGSVIVHGRSDSTLNRDGVRMGSADIYQAVEKLPEVRESLVIGAEGPDGGYWMPLFVVLAEGAELDDGLRRRIKQAIREEASPKHVPDDIIPVSAIPHTRTGKKLEVPVKRVLQGAAVAEVADPQSVDDPALLDFYAALADARRRD